MLFVFALLLAPALAAFSFQIICYANYKKDAAKSSTSSWNQQAALQNV